MDGVGRNVEFKSSFHGQRVSAIANDTRPSTASVATVVDSKVKGLGSELGCDHLIQVLHLRIYEKGRRRFFITDATRDCPEVMVLNHMVAAGSRSRLRRQLKLCRLQVYQLQGLYELIRFRQYQASFCSRCFIHWMKHLRSSSFQLESRRPQPRLFNSCG